MKKIFTLGIFNYLTDIKVREFKIKNSKHVQYVKDPDHYYQTKRNLF